jgi:hypothetical protein
MAGLCSRRGFLLPLGLNCFDSGNKAAVATELAGGIEPFGLLFDSQMEQVLVRLFERQRELLVAHVSKFDCFGHVESQGVRFKA